ncbi:hypothetical protein L218DRAFT_1081629 [Marasmius fiardii PR-910]|nr:hypothetical protein L218DRAFT_1081629 [Marasmius fiardii PR-910]
MARMLLLYLISLSLLLLTYASRELARLSSGSSHRPAYERLLTDDQQTHTASSSTSSASDIDLLGASDLVDIVLVASVDGKFHALNRTSGRLLWSMASDDGYSTTKTPTSNFSAFAPLVRTQHHPQPLTNPHPRNEDEASKLSGIRPTTTQEFYIVEPQSGDIYVASTASPLIPLQRFPHSMPELVDMAPFSFKDNDYHRYFVGRKESKLISVELETGRIREVIGGECPWDPFQEFGGPEEEDTNHTIDLDELEEEGYATIEYVDYDEEEDSSGFKDRNKKKLTEVFIGRTDYHVSIRTKPTTAQSAITIPPVQELSFSVYGPNNQDAFLQNAYTKTRDGKYVASLPTGEVLAFQSRWSNPVPQEDNRNSIESPLLWVQNFQNPIVATFDVFRRNGTNGDTPGFGEGSEQHTYVLLQPQASLRDFHPSLDLSTYNTASSDSGAGRPQSSPLERLLPNAGSAYIGIVEETGSLFAMSPDKYPFVAFDRVGPGKRKGLIDAGPQFPPGADERDQGDERFLSLDEVTKRRREREEREKERAQGETLTEGGTSASSSTAGSSSSPRPDQCNIKDFIEDGGVLDPRCFVGVWKLADSSNEKELGPGGGFGRNNNRGTHHGGNGNGKAGGYKPDRSYDDQVSRNRLDPPRRGYDTGADDDDELARPVLTENTSTRPSGEGPVQTTSELQHQSTGLLSQLYGLFMTGSGAITSTLSLAFVISAFIFLRSRSDVGLRHLIPAASNLDIHPARLPTVQEATEGTVIDPNALGNGLNNGDLTPEAKPDPLQLRENQQTSSSGVDVEGVVTTPLSDTFISSLTEDFVTRRERTLSTSSSLSTSKPLPPTPSPKQSQLLPPSTPKTPSGKLPPTPKTPKTPQQQRTRKQSSTSTTATPTDHHYRSATDSAGGNVEESDVDVGSYLEVHADRDTEIDEVDGEVDGEVEEGEEHEGEGGEGGDPVPRKSKVRRGKRGRKKRKGATGEKENVPVPVSAPVLAPGTPTPGQLQVPGPLMVVVPSTPTVTKPSLIVSDTILGFGSHGTVVFRGDLQGRQVAVKRLLKSFVTLASREVSILQESDDHPNVIRYYYQEAHADFLYIALELCPATLADIIEYAAAGGFEFGGEGRSGKEGMKPEEWSDLIRCFDPKKALKQIASGLRHLHALKLVHRDIKPQNILVSAGPGRGGAARARGSMGGYRMLISDFGLCKKLDMDQTSFLPTAQGAMGAGTVGWRAPEILRGEVKLDIESATSGDDHSSRGSSIGTATIGSTGTNGTASSGSGTKPTRLTKSVDIFALGCLFYYTLTNGLHPFGDRFEREVNILKAAVNLDGLDKVDGGSGGRWSEEAVEARDLIEQMLSDGARDRPDTTKCLLHPFFWDSGRRLNFLQDASDRFEVMCRDPKDDHLLSLEEGAPDIVGTDWYARMDRVFVENLGKFRKYDGKSVQDLLRALRNKKHHYQDLPDNVKRHLGSMPEGYLTYFTKRYPRLFMHVHRVVGESELKDEDLFNTYFELAEQ